ncbi:MAG TPA: hypothetical protein VGT08_12190 [Terracidiphilus sp.]|nr:hypothetical protein [Terracidiphilus sp.]
MNDESPYEGMMSKPKSKTGWSHVKAKLAALDRNAVLGLVHDLYAASKHNQAFLHARFGLGEGVLAPYKKTVGRWLWPDVLRNQDVSVSKAKQAISDYKKAVGEPAGVSELTVYYCEQAAGFCQDIGYQDEGYFNALVRAFEQAIKMVVELDVASRDRYMMRLDRVRQISHDFGYGVGDDMDYLVAEHTKDVQKAAR